MKKILVSLLVLALCTPAMAATVGIVDNTDGTATITVTAEGTDNIVGLGLDINVTGGNATACTVDTATFDIFPDAAHDLEVATPGSYTYGAGTPIANQLTVGEAAVSNSFAISVGALNGPSTPGATGSASVEITITVDADSTVCVKENAIRGGIVLTTGAGEDITNGTAGEVCGAVTTGPTGPTCQDFNLTKKKAGATDNVVNASDLGNLINYVNANKTGALFVVNSLNAAYDEDYNFTKLLGGTDNVINASDLGAMINFVNANKTGALFVVNCTTCGC